MSTVQPSRAGSSRATSETRDTYGVKLVRGPYLKLPPHPLSVETELELIARADEFRRPLAADLFCGAGGLSIGLTEAGFDVILGIDHDDAALETHRAYHPGLSVNWDLGDEDLVERVGNLIKDLDVAIVAGGPPCQPFSRAGRSALRDLVRRGRRPPHDLRRELWQSFLRIVAIARPPAVLMENVPDMALDKDMLILRTMVDELEALGYGVEERLVATSEYGVPQLRHRLILVAIAGGVEFKWPQSQPEVNLRSAIGDLPPVDGGWRPDNGDVPDDPVASGWITYGSPVTKFQQRMRRDVPGGHTDRLYDHITRPVREDDARAFAQMDSTTLYSEIDDDLKRYRDDIFDDKYKRLDWNSLSRTITAHIAKDGYWYIHPEHDRTLTVREAARIQTFPDNVRFAGPPTAAFRQIGNAVPPLLGEHLGRSILESIAEGHREPLSTTQTAVLLADWFVGREYLSVPWLRSTTRWQVIQAGILWARIARETVREAWASTAKLVSPKQTLEPSNAAALEMYARLRGREDRAAVVMNAAEWFVDHPDTLKVTSSVTELVAAPGVSTAVADLAVRVCPGTAADRPDPVLVTNGVLRVASRCLGINVESQNRYSDGRLAVARLIGGDDNSHEAHLGLIELASSVCVAGPNPDCGNCPLLANCDFAKHNNFQTTLPLTIPGSLRRRGSRRVGAR